MTSVHASPEAQTAVSTVGIVDDQPLLVAAFTALIDAQPDLEGVGTGTDGLMAIELVRQHHPDVLLMLSLIHISEPTRRHHVSRMPSSA